MPEVSITITARDMASKAFRDVQSAGGQAGQFLKENWKGIAVGAAAAGAAIEAVGRKAAAQNEALKKAAEVVGMTSKALRQLTIDTANVTFPTEDAIKLFELAGKQGLKTGEELKKYATFWDTVGDATGESAVMLAKAGIALKGMGIEIGKEETATAAFGFIIKKTTMNVGEFLTFIDKAGPDLREMGMNINDTAGIVGVLTNELGMSARTARSEFIAAVSESKGNLEELYKILGVTEEQVKTYTDAVEGCGDVVQDLADIHADSYSILQKIQHEISELALKHGELIQKAADLAPLLIAVSVSLTAIMTIGPPVKAALTAISASMTKVAATSKAAAFGIKSIKTALLSLTAFVVGWEIGRMLANKFDFVRRLGISLAGGFMKVWIGIKGYAKAAANGLAWAFTKAFDSVKKALASLMISLANALKKMPDKLVPDGWIKSLEDTSASVTKSIKTEAEWAAKAEEALAKMREEMAKVDALAAEMWDRVPAAVAKKAPKKTGASQEGDEPPARAGQKINQVAQQAEEAARKVAVSVSNVVQKFHGLSKASEGVLFEIQDNLGKVNLFQIEDGVARQITAMDSLQAAMQRHGSAAQTNAELTKQFWDDMANWSTDAAQRIISDGYMAMAKAATAWMLAEEGALKAFGIAMYRMVAQAILGLGQLAAVKALFALAEFFLLKDPMALKAAQLYGIVAGMSLAVGAAMMAHASKLEGAASADSGGGGGGRGGGGRGGGGAREAAELERQPFFTYPLSEPAPAYNTTINISVSEADFTTPTRRREFARSIVRYIEEEQAG